jgi:hypothetical protein
MRIQCDRTVSVTEARSGWQSNVTCIEVEEQMEQRIRDNRRIIIDKNCI